MFLPDLVSVLFDSNGVDDGDGMIPVFVMTEKNTTTFRTVVSVSREIVIDDSNLRSDLKKKKKSLLLKIRLDTKVKAKIGSLKMKKVPIKVTCDGIKAVVPIGKTMTTAVINVVLM